MPNKKDSGLRPVQPRDPFSLLRQMRSEIGRLFEDPFWLAPARPFPAAAEAMVWAPAIEVFEKDRRLVTRIELPGLKKEDVKVEVTDGQLAISGERKREAETKTDSVYRCEREYGRFYRAVPLPEGVKIDDVKATFADGVLEVTVPLPAAAQAEIRSVPIQEPAKPAKTAA
jgi:HSP20 family protein